MLDVTAIGAGGSTPAWLDTAGAFNLGPRSAGADPGPVSYGRGGPRQRSRTPTWSLGI